MRRHDQPGRWSTGERGSLTAELVVLTPVIILLALFIVALGRVEVIRAQVAGAARAAAEAAATAADAPMAVAAARSAAPAALAGDRVGCTRLHVRADTTAFAPGGRVTVDLRCWVELADLAVPGLPGSVLLSSVVTAPVDPYRQVP